MEMGEANGQFPEAQMVDKPDGVITKEEDVKRQEKLTQPQAATFSPPTAGSSSVPPTTGDSWLWCWICCNSSSHHHHDHSHGSNGCCDCDCDCCDCDCDCCDCDCGGSGDCDCGDGGCDCGSCDC